MIDFNVRLHLNDFLNYNILSLSFAYWFLDNRRRGSFHSVSVCFITIHLIRSMRKYFLLLINFSSHNDLKCMILSVFCDLIRNYFLRLFRVWGVTYSPNGSKIESVAEDRSINIYNCQI